MNSKYEQIKTLHFKIFPNAVPSKDSAGAGLNQTETATASVSQILFSKKRLLERCYPGSYIINSYLLRALRKLEGLVDFHMQSIGAQRILMPSLSPSHLWKDSGRWDLMGKELFRVEDRNDNQLCLAPTHEETVCSMVANHQLSYKSLPLLLYQITGKFRDEPHQKHGLLRGREFIMKDLYTFDENETQAKKTYNMVVNAYENIFKELSLNVIKVAADPGAIGGSTSHEYHIESAVGEDTLKLCDKCGDAVNIELYTDVHQPKNCQYGSCTEKRRTVKGIELAHTFLLGDRYSKPLNVTYRSKENKPEYTYMGCYGIGVSRLLAAAVEVLSTSSHMKMPRVISPYQLVIIPQKKGYKFEETLHIAEQVYDELERIPSTRGEVVIDDRFNQSIGQRIRDAKLMGFPLALCVSKQALASEGGDETVEILDLYEGESQRVALQEITSYLSARVATVQHHLV
ncbi:PARS2 [Bugula neritina]|uniref:Probable proline--tRNA ligase, mitochondrial n=1 Tax=Bugula neritina TaxID=10212 RepID=A0A7J7IYP4_BUGNE|nr:PARS2 [Bugula neritina]